MKKGNKFFKVASRFAVPTLIALMLVSAVTIFWGLGVLPNIDKTKKFSFFGRFIMYYNNGTLPEILGNILAYGALVAGIVLMILVLKKVKHNKELRAKAAFLSILMIWPATLGLLDGIFDLMPHGYYTLTNAKTTDATMMLALLVFTYILDVLYIVFAINVAAGALKEAKMVEQGINPNEEEQPQQPVQQQAAPVQSEEDKEKEHQQLLDDIRRIVREELDRLDRVAIITESEAPAEEPAKEEPVEEPEAEEPAPEEAPVDPELNKIPNAPRVPFAEKIVAADKDIKDKYNELKNEVLAYGPSSRLSVAGDTFRLRRKAYVKITLVGKTLKVYFALNPNDYVDSPIPVFDAGDKASYEDVPAMLKVRSDLSVRRAKELIAAAFAVDGIEKGEVQEHNHVRDISKDLKEKKK